MIEKKFKLSFIFTVLTLLLFSSATVFASQSTPTIKRLSGGNRYATSAEVALNGWTQSNYAILASEENFPDAISAAPLAKKYDSPILLTETDFIPAETLNAIQQLKVKNIIIIGGTGSISESVEKQLASSGMSVTRIFGQDRYETCIKIAEQLGNVTEIAVVTGESFPDALSISPVAVKRNMPIILVSHNEIPSVVKDYINSHKLTATYVIGSGTSLNNAVFKGLSNVELVTGADKYQINLNIIDKFKSDLNLGTVYVASGEGFADALSGSILAGKNSNPLLLIANDPSTQKNYFANNSNTISNINVLGGIGVVPDEVINKFIGKSTTTTSSGMDKIEFISTDLTKTGPNTATFQYKVLDKNGEDITKTVPVSEIYAVASVSSSITLDPLTGTGTIIFNSSSDTDKQVIVTLIDKVTGKVVTLNAKYSESQPIDISKLLPVAKIDFPSTNLTKIGTSKATFSYKILDKNGTDITKTVPASDLHAISWIGSSSYPISLNPQMGTGTITYNFSDTDKNITVQLAYNNGIVGTSMLSFDDSKTVTDTKVAKIIFPTFTLTKTGPNTATFQYKVLNKNDEDITEIVPVSELNAVASVSSSITLNPLTGIGTIALNTSYDSDEPIFVTISHNATGITERIEYSPLNPAIGIGKSKRISKIIITSTVVMVYSPKNYPSETDEISGIGYAAFEVLDENRKNITSSQLAKNIEFKCDVATVSANNGIVAIKLDKDVDVTTLKSMVITATDSITGVSTSATLSIDSRYFNE